MKKRLTALFLCLLMLFVLVPAAAADGEPEESAAAQQPVSAEEPEPLFEVAAEEPEGGFEAVAAEPEEGGETAAEPEEEPEAIAEEPEEGVEAVLVKPEEGLEAIVLDPADSIEASSGVILINEENFPDANFRKWIVYSVPGVTVDANGVCSITKEDAKKITALYVNSADIGSLSGVSKFSNLETLACDGNHLKYLDVSSLKQLKYLSCKDNKLEKLVLGNLKNLETLYCSNNKLSTVSLTRTPALKYLIIDHNAFTSLDVSACPQLIALDCFSNQLKTLDVSKNTKLQSLICSTNLLEKLDVTKNTALVELLVKFNAIKTLDVSKNVKLTHLECTGCELKQLDVTKNTLLTVLEAGTNELTALDLTKNTALESLNCSGNALKTIDLTKNTKLTMIDVCGNLLTAIDLSKNTALLELGVYDNRLKALDLTNNKELTFVNADSNELQTLNVTACTKLETLYCEWNELTALNVTNNVKLKTLSCAHNRLMMLELTPLTLLETVECNDQKVLAPDVIHYYGGDYHYDMYTIFSDISRIESAVYPFNKLYGYVTLPGYIPSFDYTYDTGRKDTKMTVTLCMPYSGTAKVEFLKSGVSFKGTTPYVIYNGKEQEPAFRVLDEKGNLIDETLYTYTYTSNKMPGTGYVNITFINTSNTAKAMFKIYLPGTTETSVENVKTGIKITWKAVKDAKGYVIYRRAWSSTTNGWTDFKRWNNTTKTEWIDTTVYAGTRYQYGIKAYFSDPMDNYNLGEVGPLKTTVRITTRVLKEAKPYSKSIVVKWEGSSVFTGYQVQYARDAAFTKSVKTIKVKKATTYKQSISGLNSGTTYYVRVRSYHEFEGMTYFGEWSNVLNAKAK